MKVTQILRDEDTGAEFNITLSEYELSLLDYIFARDEDEETDSGPAMERCISMGLGV